MRVMVVVYFLHKPYTLMRVSPEELEVSWRDGRVERHPPMDSCAEGVNPETPKHLWHQRVIENFLDAVQLGQEPMATGREALASHRLIEAIELSSHDGIAVDLPVQ